MIRSISLRGVWGVEGFEFLSGLPALGFLKEGKLEFKEGLNVLHAPNGAGKSTILRVMAEVTASYQGGVSTFTNSWLSEKLVRALCKGAEFPLEWDGECVLYSNPRNAVGLIGGMAAFDDDFFAAGLRNLRSKSSTGITTLERQEEILEILLGKRDFPSSIKSKVGLDCVGYSWGNIPKGNPTILLDEPESGFSLVYQERLFNLLRVGAENGFQVIVATHSPFGLFLDGNHIDLVESHQIKELASLSSLASFFVE